MEDNKDTPEIDKLDSKPIDRTTPTSTVEQQDINSAEQTDTPSQNLVEFETSKESDKVMAGGSSNKRPIKIFLYAIGIALVLFMITWYLFGNRINKWSAARDCGEEPIVLTTDWKSVKRYYSPDHPFYDNTVSQSSFSLFGSSIEFVCPGDVDESKLELTPQQQQEEYEGYLEEQQESFDINFEKTKTVFYTPAELPAEYTVDDPFWDDIGKSIVQWVRYRDRSGLSIAIKSDDGSGLCEQFFATRNLDTCALSGETELGEPVYKNHMNPTRIFWVFRIEDSIIEMDFDMKTEDYFGPELDPIDYDQVIPIIDSFERGEQ